MQEREILIANTKTQKRSKITTDATTLGELKTALDAAGIDYSGMTFTEGISKTQLLDDITPLPRDVMFKGTPTNNLVILLTNTKKNIASGCGSRKDAYDIIKEENLAEDIKEQFGINYTHISTADLWEFINNREDEDIEEDVEDEDNEEDYNEEPEPQFDEKEVYTNLAVSAAYDSIKALVKLGIMTPQALKDLIDMLNDLAATVASEDISMTIGTTTITGDDVNDMIANL